MLSSRLSISAGLSVVVLAGGLAGCGGGSSKPSDDQLAQARREGRNAERQRENEQKTRDLQKQLDDLKKQNAKKASSGKTRTVTVSGGGQSSAPPPSSGNCGGGLSVNSVTSCAFAQNVRSVYDGTGRYVIHSPTTGKDYFMDCSGGSPTICTGGNNAYVSFN